MCSAKEREKNPHFSNPHRRLTARESRPKHAASNRAVPLLLTDQTTDWSADVLRTASHSLNVTGVLARNKRPVLANESGGGAIEGQKEVMLVMRSRCEVSAGMCVCVDSVSKLKECYFSHVRLAACRFPPDSFV